MSEPLVATKDLIRQSIAKSGALPLDVQQLNEVAVMTATCVGMAVEERDTLITALRECVVAASDMLDYDQENQVPVCHCCGMELDGRGRGHRTDCLAELVLSHASTLERYKHEHP